MAILPQVLNTLPAGVVRAGIQRYFFFLFLVSWQSGGDLTSRILPPRGTGLVVCCCRPESVRSRLAQTLIAAVTHSPGFAFVSFSFILSLPVSRNVPRIFSFVVVVLFSRLLHSWALRRRRGGGAQSPCARYWSINQNIGVTRVSSSTSEAVFHHYAAPHCHINLSFLFDIVSWGWDWARSLGDAQGDRGCRRCRNGICMSPGLTQAARTRGSAAIFEVCGSDGILAKTSLWGQTRCGSSSKRESKLKIKVKVNQKLPEAFYESHDTIV